MQSKVSYRRLISSHLREDKRLHAEPVAKKRIYRNDSYEILLYVYACLRSSGPRTDLVVGVVRYVEESLELFVKLETYRASRHPEEHITALVESYHSGGKKPLQLVREAKAWCNVPLTNTDVALLSEIGIAA